MRKLTLTIGTCLLLTGCVSLDSARSLSAAGVQTGDAAKAVLNAADPMAANYLARETLRAAIENDTPPTEAFRMQVDQVSLNLELRKQLISDLVDAYSAFGALADYDATERYSTALSALDVSIAAFAKEVKRPVPNLSKAATRGPIVLGWYANWVRSGALMRGSKSLAERVSVISNLLEAEKEISKSLFETYATQNKALTLGLWRLNFLSARDAFADQKLVSGFAIVPDTATFTSSNDKATAVVTAITELRVQSEVRRYSAQLDTSILALKELKAQHETFEATREVNLSQLKAVIAQLNTLVEK
jgi:hypothetical protein